MGKLINANKEEFNNIIDSEEGVVLVDFWAEWCGPCRVLGPTLQTVSEDADDVTVVKVNVDENSELSAEYSVRSIPTVIVFKNGEQVDKFVGNKSESEIKSIIEKNSEDNTKEEEEDES